MTPEQIHSIAQSNEFATTEFAELMSNNTDDSSIDDILEDFWEYQGPNEWSDDNNKIFALMEHLDINYPDAESLIDSGDWKVLDEGETDYELDNYINNYIIDVILPEIPINYHQYIDIDRIISDMEMDGRGMIASYDGEEHEMKMFSTTYYLYRMN